MCENLFGFSAFVSHSLMSPVKSLVQISIWSFIHIGKSILSSVLSVGFLAKSKEFSYWVLFSKLNLIQLSSKSKEFFYWVLFLFSLSKEIFYSAPRFFVRIIANISSVKVSFKCKPAPILSMYLLIYKGCGLDLKMFRNCSLFISNGVSRIIVQSASLIFKFRSFSQEWHWSLFSQSSWPL